MKKALSHIPSRLAVALLVPPLAILLGGAGCGGTRSGTPGHDQAADLRDLPASQDAGVEAGPDPLSEPGPDQGFAPDTSEPGPEPPTDNGGGLDEAVGPDAGADPGPDPVPDPLPDPAADPEGDDFVPDPIAPDQQVEPGPDVPSEPTPEVPVEPTPDPVAEPVAEPAPDVAEPGPDASPDALTEDGATEWQDVADAAEIAPDLPADTAPVDVAPPPPPLPLITEFMASNHGTLRDEDGESSDWIEVHNPTGEPLGLAGFSLTDNADKPAKWVFPDVTIPPGGYLVVFASGKNRTDPARELHTNFKLDAEGEYLALVDPAGKVLHEFFSYPAQVTDASYGPKVAVKKSLLVATGDLARFRVASAADPEDWAEATFDDEAAAGFETGQTGIGFDLTTEPEVPADLAVLGEPLADSTRDWSVKGIQGAKGWTSGYYDRSSDPDQVYSADAFIPFPHDGSGHGPSDFWTGTAWDWYAGDPPWTAIGVEYAHPAAAGNGGEHWAMRRYRVAIGGPLLVEWHIGKVDPAGSGVTGHVFHNGVEVDAAAIPGVDTTGVTRRVVLPGAQAGDTIDFALAPQGPAGEPDDTSDSSVITARIWLLPDVSTEVATDVGHAMAGVASGLRARVRFAAPGPGSFNRLLLRVKYDDGFVAWLNGAPLAAANAPADPAFDSAALVDRPVAAATSFETFDVRDALDLLAETGNVLAIHAMNSAPGDPTFLVVPELEGRRVTYDRSQPRYYGHPTPGADNDDGPCDIGPAVQHLTSVPPPAEGESIEVTARVTPTCAPGAVAVLRYRVMFGPEVEVPMTGEAGGTFAGTIPPGAAAGQMVRWYIVASDGAGNTTRAPAFEDPLDSEQYFGTIVFDPSLSSNLPVLHLFVENFAAAGTWAGTRASLYYEGEFYDNVKIDLHGQSTSGFPKKSYDLDFNSDHRFRLLSHLARMKDINLLTNYADKSKIRNTLAYETYRRAGAGYHLAFPVRINLNGAFYAVQDFVEDGDDRWLERLGLDPEGALYKMYDSMVNTKAGEKKTRKDEDKADLQAFIDGLGQTGEALRNFLYDNVNIPAMVSFSAAQTLTANMDCCHKNYYAYRDTNGSGEWRYLPWDVDLTFGRNWIKTLTYFDDTMHPDNPLFAGANNRLIGALFALPEYKQMYLRRLRTLMDEIQQPPGLPESMLAFEARIDELVAQIGNDGLLDYLAGWKKWGQDQTMEVAAQIMKEQYMAPRRVYLFHTMSVPGGGPIPGPQVKATVEFSGVDIGGTNPLEAFVALWNPGDTAVDVTGWQLDGDISFRFAPGTVIPASGTIYVAADLRSFRRRHHGPSGGQGLFVVGNWTGVLSDPTTLTLTDREGNLIAAM